MALESVKLLALLASPQRRPHRRMGSCRRRLAILSIGLAVFILAASSSAAPPVTQTINISTGDFMRLPAYCADSQYGGRYDPGNFTSAQKRWVVLMGSTFHHIHHYCLALESAQKAQNPTISRETRASFYGNALGNANYVVERAPPDFVLLPEIFLRMGQFHLGRGDIASALEYFEKSRHAKKDYWPAYVEIAKANLSIGRRQEAEAALKAGLEVMPTDSNLKQALERLKAITSGARKSPPN